MLINDLAEKTKISSDASACACCDISMNEEASNEMSRRLALCFLGGIFILNSFIASFVQSMNFAADLSAIIGALILGIPILITAVKDIRNGKVHMNELVALAILAAFAQQSYQTAGLISFFMLITISIEQKTAIGARASIESLIKLTPSTTRKILDDGIEIQIEVASLNLGDLCRIRPGENFPGDGLIIKGDTTVNESTITGESLPQDKAINAQVYAGTHNLTGAVDIKITHIGHDTTLGKVSELISAAEKTKLPVTRMVDNYIVFYTPVILIIAGFVWFFTGDMNRVIAVLVVSCPCAYVIATPSATIAAIAASARLGILIKNVTHIELAAKIRSIIFDKTGTLTKGDLEVAKLFPVDGVELSDLVKVAATTESQSNHPTAKAMLKLVTNAKIQLEQVTNYKEIHGKGVEAKIEGKVCRVGRESWLNELNIKTDILKIEDKSKIAGMSLIFVASESRLLGCIGLRDAVRPSSKNMISELSELGVHTCMVTGDNVSVANLVAQEIGISEVMSDCLPQEKVEYVKKLKEREGLVAVVGDGVNDAPALAEGDIGIAMGAMGSDIAVSSASIALMNTDLSKIPFLLKISRQTRSIIDQNVSLALLFMVGGLYLSAMGILHPAIAAAMHSISSLIVLFNSARLVRQGEELDHYNNE